MEARPTIVPRSTPHQRRRITTAAARRINTARATTRRRAITRRLRVTIQRPGITSRRLAITHRGQGRVTGLIRTKVGVIMAVDATAGTAVVVTTEVVAAVTVDRPGMQTAQEAPFFVGETKSVVR